MPLLLTGKYGSQMHRAVEREVIPQLMMLVNSIRRYSVVNIREAVVAR